MGPRACHEKPWMLHRRIGEEVSVQSVFCGINVGQEAAIFWAAIDTAYLLETGTLCMGETFSHEGIAVEMKDDEEKWKQNRNRGGARG